MLFNSPQFLFAFLPVTLVVTFLLAAHGRRLLTIGWLLLASLAFYAWNEPFRLLPIIVSSIVFNFVIGARLARTPSPGLLTIGVGGDLLLLGFFKYSGFLARTVTTLTGLVVPVPAVELPIGISFFTFTQIAFLVDAARGEARSYTPSRYGLFVTFFPHLIAGPIYHHRQIVPQFDRPQTFRFDLSSVMLGLTWLALGLGKKVLLADPLALYASPVFEAATRSRVGVTDGWIGVLAFTLQLYFDFSGYSDMAIGLGLMLGVRLPPNFDSPYKATSLIDFWQRWHMTLSGFLRAYLYIPLGGNRRGLRRRYVNLMITMLLGGLWHGAASTFIVWGGIHGVGLMVNHWWRHVASARRLVMPAPLGRALTFTFVVVAWVPFRAASLQATLLVYKSLAGFGRSRHVPAVLAGQFTGAVCAIVALLLLVLAAPNTQQLMSYPRDPVADIDTPLRRPGLLWAAVAGLLLGAAVSSILVQRPTEFLYFRF